jgi:hypothetical protein
MPASSNAQLNAWADNRARVIADAITQFRYKLDAYLTDYTAEGIAALISADGASNYLGGQDSRVPITGLQILNQKAALLQVQVAMGTTLVSGVGATVNAINDAIQVNGSPR